jgi:hypothetical protein
LPVCDEDSKYAMRAKTPHINLALDARPAISTPPLHYRRDSEREPAAASCLHANIAPKRDPASYSPPPALGPDPEPDVAADTKPGRNPVLSPQADAPGAPPPPVADVADADARTRARRVPLARLPVFDFDFMVPRAPLPATGRADPSLVSEQTRLADVADQSSDVGATHEEPRRRTVVLPPLAVASSPGAPRGRPSSFAANDADARARAEKIPLTRLPALDFAVARAPQPVSAARSADPSRAAEQQQLAMDRLKPAPAEDSQRRDVGTARDDRRLQTIAVLHALTEQRSRNAALSMAAEKEREALRQELDAALRKADSVEKEKEALARENAALSRRAADAEAEATRLRETVESMRKVLSA